MTRDPCSSLVETSEFTLPPLAVGRPMEYAASISWHLGPRGFLFCPQILRQRVPPSLRLPASPLARLPAPPRL